MPDELVLTCYCRLEALAVIAATVRRVALPILGEVGAFQLDVAITELCSNIIRHGQAHRDNPEATFTVTVRAVGHRVDVELRDRSQAFIPDAAPRMPATDVDLADLPERGFGLAIVAQTMDVFERRHEGGFNVTRISKANLP